MMNGNQTSGDDHFVMNTNVESQCWTPKAQITLYIKKKKKNKTNNSSETNTAWSNYFKGGKS